MSARDVDLNSKEWCELVFEGRNKEYGAYYLRKTSTRRHLFAFLTVIVATIIVILFFEIIQFGRTLQSENEYEIKPVELSSLIGLEENNNNRIEQVKAEKQSPLKDIVQFTPPTITKDEDIEQIQKELQEINLSPDSIDLSATLEDSLLLQREMTQLNRDEESDTAVVDEKNRNARFQDGKTALLRYIYQNIHYPPVALRQRINGRVVCSFIVNEDGSLSDITLVQGVYVFLDDEVLRVVRAMPVWNPALKDGKPVKVKYIMPVVFKLN